MINSEIKKSLIYSFIFSLIYCYGIISSHLNYLDDFGRYTLGYTSWSSNGRPFADAIMIIINFGKPLVDLSPLPILLSLFCLCLTGVLLAKKFTPQSSFLFYAVVTCLLISNPFFLENLSFKYDILAMSLSICFIMLCFIHDKNKSLGFSISTLFIFLSLGLYQSTIGSFIILALTEASLNFLAKKTSIQENLIKLANRVTQLLLGYIIYNILIVRNLIHDEYSHAHSEIIHINSSGLRTVYANFCAYVHLLVAYFHCMPIIMRCAYEIIFIILSIVIGRYFYKSGRGMLLSLLAIGIPSLILFTSFAPMIILKSPVISSRVMTSFGLVLFSLGILSKHFLNKLKIFAYLYLPLLILNLVISTSYANAWVAQKNKDNQVISLIYTDVAKIGQDVKYVDFTGGIRLSEQRQLAVEKFPVLNDILKSYLGKDSFWSSYMLTNGGVHVNYKNFSKDQRKLICESKTALKSIDYTIHIYKEDMIISFDSPCQ